MFKPYQRAELSISCLSPSGPTISRKWCFFRVPWDAFKIAEENQHAFANLPSQMSKDVQGCPKYIYCAKDVVNLGVMKSVLWISVIMSHHYVILCPNRRTIRIQWESPQCPITRAQCGAVSLLLVLGVLVLGDEPLRATEIRGRSDSDNKWPQSQWKPRHIIIEIKKHIKNTSNSELTQSAVADFSHSSSYHSVTSERFRQGTGQQSHSPVEVLFVPL